MPGMVTGVRAGELIFFSAIRGRDPSTNASSDDTREQAAQAFENLRVLLESLGLTLRNVVKITMYLNDLAYRTRIEEVWKKYFPVDPPAWTTMQVADANASPGGNAHFVFDVIAQTRPA
jgi:2-iminobutanoate/2-iminopropanoate deaminase